MVGRFPLVISFFPLYFLNLLRYLEPFTFKTRLILMLFNLLYIIPRRPVREQGRLRVLLWLLREQPKRWMLIWLLPVIWLPHQFLLHQAWKLKSSSLRSAYQAWPFCLQHLGRNKIIKT
jgi:hypothetical protein